MRVNDRIAVMALRTISVIALVPTGDAAHVSTPITPVHALLGRILFTGIFSPVCGIKTEETPL
jgi:hypothetical protein